MTIYQPPTSYSASIVRPPCPECSTMMHLARIEPVAPGHDKRTFKCPRCEHSETVIVKFK